MFLVGMISAVTIYIELFANIMLLAYFKMSMYVDDINLVYIVTFSEILCYYWLARLN